MKRRKENGTTPWVHQYRIVVKENQRKLLEEIFSISSRIYTELFRFVDEMKRKSCRVSLSDVSKFFARRRREEKDYSLVPAHTGYFLAIRAYNAYERCLKERKSLKIPKDEEVREVLSVPYRYQGRTKIFQNEKGNWFVHIPNVGNLKLKFHRPLPSGAEIKHLEIVKKADGYYLSIHMDIPEESLVKRLPPTGQAVGIDVGIQNLITLSTGERIPHPKWLQKTLEKISLKQSILSKKQKGSRRYWKLRNNIQKLYLKVTRQRKDFYHTLSKWLVEHHDYICVEDLNSKEMIEKSSEAGWKNLTKGIIDASWGMFLNQILPTKTRLTGRTLIYVDPQYTSQLCSNCLKLVPKSLDERIHRCPYCGIEMDRDINAARSILILGLRQAFGDIVPFGAMSCPRSSRGFSFPNERLLYTVRPTSENGRPLRSPLPRMDDWGHQPTPEDGRDSISLGADDVDLDPNSEDGRPMSPRPTPRTGDAGCGTFLLPEDGRDFSSTENGRVNHHLNSPRTDEKPQTDSRERTRSNKTPQGRTTVGFLFSAPRTDETSQTIPEDGRPEKGFRPEDGRDPTKLPENGRPLVRLNSSSVVSDGGTEGRSRQTENETERTTNLSSSGDRTLPRGFPFGGDERRDEERDKGNGSEIGETFTEGCSSHRPVLVVGDFDGTETKFIDLEGG